MAAKRPRDEFAIAGSSCRACEHERRTREGSQRGDTFITGRCHDDGADADREADAQQAEERQNPRTTQEPSRSS
jgi:hypothetical protein